MKIFTIFILTSSILFAGIFDFKTISSDFKQTITNEENTKIIYEGNLYATTDAKALWEYKKPVNKKIYFNQNRVVILEPELEQAIVTDLQSTPNLTELLKSAKKIDEKTYETSYDDITYTIHAKSGQIDYISYMDKLENRVTIQMLNLTTNTVLDDSLFRVTIPSNYDIITQ